MASQKESANNSTFDFYYYKFRTALAIVMSLFQLYTAFFGSLEGLLQRAIHVGFALTLVFLFSGKSRIQKIVSLVFVGLSMAALGWIVLDYPRVSVRWPLVDELLGQDLILGALTIILILEGTRRAMGWALPLIASLFLVYAYVGPHMPGLLQHRGYSISLIIDELYLTTEGIFGVAASASATFVFLFILFGSFLEKTKVGEFFIDLAYALTGSLKGGPAKTAVVASGFMGMISGSGIGNVATTGVFTIPLMKKLGYKPHIAGAIEAAASSGGQIMPPLMGASAFIMTEFTGVAYLEIIKVAFIPAVLYFLMILLQVHFRAYKKDLPIIPREQLPSFKHLFKTKFHLFLPIAVLVTLLVMQYTPLFAGVWAIVACIVVSAFNPETRLNLKSFLESLEKGAATAAPIALACASAGIIVGVTTLTGLGMKFSSLIVSGANGSLLIAMILVAITALVLGMGLPVVAAYVVMAILAAPALAELGVPILAAHLIVMWFTQTSNITPPVCLAAFTAAGIAESSPMRTGFAAMRFGLGLFFIPFLFAYSPILLTGTPVNVAHTVVTAVLGIVAISAAFEGYLSSPLSAGARILMGISGVLLVWPKLAVSLVGLLLVVLTVIQGKVGSSYQHQQARKG